MKFDRSLTTSLFPCSMFDHSPVPPPSQKGAKWRKVKIADAIVQYVYFDIKHLNCKLNSDKLFKKIISHEWCSIQFGNFFSHFLIFFTLIKKIPKIQVLRISLYNLQDNLSYYLATIWAIVDLSRVDSLSGSSFVNEDM